MTALLGKLAFFLGACNRLAFPFLLYVPTVPFLSLLTHLRSCAIQGHVSPQMREKEKEKEGNNSRMSVCLLHGYF